MTVAELIAHLQQLPQDAIVTWGEYDEIGEAFACEITDSQFIRLGEPVFGHAGARLYQSEPDDPTVGAVLLF